jgi:hypothetical protein
MRAALWRSRTARALASVGVEAEDQPHRRRLSRAVGSEKARFPSGHYNANSAWTVIACLAHNLIRWTDQLGLQDPTPRTARPLRYRLFALPARLTRTARQDTLHFPARWPWQHAFIEALTRIRALPAAA